MENNLLDLFATALGEMARNGLGAGWRVVKTRRDYVEFERIDRRASIFWDGSAELRWMVADENDQQFRGPTLADCVDFARAAGLAL